MSDPSAACEALGLSREFADSEWLSRHGEQLLGMLPLDLFEAPQPIRALTADAPDVRTAA